MSENMHLIVGLLALAIPFFAAGFLMLRRQPAIFRMYAVMLLVGLGYLTATGAISDIGRKVLGQPSLPPIPVPTVKAKPEPAAVPAAAPAPAAAPTTAPATAPAATPTPAAPAPAAAPATPAPAR